VTIVTFQETTPTGAYGGGNASTDVVSSLSMKAKIATSTRMKTTTTESRNHQVLYHGVTGIIGLGSGAGPDAGVTGSRGRTGVIGCGEGETQTKV